MTAEGGDWVNGGVELDYNCKALEKEVLEGTRPALLREERAFGDRSERQNLLILGDNLSVLKTLIGMASGVRLIYIDPPFGTGDVYRRGGFNAYSSKRGVEYLEWLRERVILLKHLLSDDGSFYIRIDYHYGHYVKVLLDEIFGRKNFRNEIIVNRTKKIFDGLKKFNTATDSVYFYTKTDNYTFNGYKKSRDESRMRWVPMHSPGERWTRIWDSDIKFEDIVERGGVRYTRARMFEGREYLPPPGRHWTFTQERLDGYAVEGRVKANGEMLEYRMGREEIVDSNWTDIPGYSFKWDYPTENSEQLLERIIEASSNPGDLVLDCFAGSGTTGAVAEKLGRRWIMVDSSRYSIETIVKRMLNLREGVGNRGKKLEANGFLLCVSREEYI